jgi:hypothetical protein
MAPEDNGGIGERPKNIGVLGIELERKSDILSFAALVLSLLSFAIVVGGVAFQVYHYSRGPQISFLRPDYVVIASQTHRNGKKHILLFVPVSVVNEGHPDYYGIIDKIAAGTRVDGNDYMFKWDGVVELSEPSPGKLKVEVKGSTHPTVVKGGEGAAWLVKLGPSDTAFKGFVASRVGSFLKTQNLINEIREFEGKNPKGTGLKKSITFMALVGVSKVVKKECMINLRGRDADALQQGEESKAWTISECE